MYGRGIITNFLAFLYFLRGENILLTDLHVHTRLSNGSMGIEEVLSLAKANGVTTLSITDHDCIAGTARAKVLGEQMGLNVLIGSELTAIDEATGNVVNILCYAPDVSDRLEGLCQANRSARKMAFMFIVKEICKNYPVSKAVIERCYQGSTCIYKQHIMHALIESGCAGSFYGNVHDDIFTPDGKNFISVKPKYAKASDVINLIHASGGVAVLAHPVLYKDDTILDRFKELGIDGIEVFHPSANEEQTSALLSFAGKKLLVTGGSDFRGLYNKTCNTIGSYGLSEAQTKEFMKSKDKIKRLNKKESE